MLVGNLKEKTVLPTWGSVITQPITTHSIPYAIGRKEVKRFKKYLKKTKNSSVESCIMRDTIGGHTAVLRRMLEIS